DGRIGVFARTNSQSGTNEPNRHRDVRRAREARWWRNFTNELSHARSNPSAGTRRRPRRCLDAGEDELRNEPRKWLEIIDLAVRIARCAAAVTRASCHRPWTAPPARR